MAAKNGTTRLSQSVDRVSALLEVACLSEDDRVHELLTETHQRRGLDLSDLPANEQAALLASRCQQLQPSADSVAERIVEAVSSRRPFVAKFGIDPTGAEVHLGHAVPMLLLSRIQRMGHHVVFIVGDMTATIGDPSGRSDERPTLTSADIEQNLATYRQQVSPFFDFDRAEFRRNGDWLNQFRLPELISIASRIPMSMPLQRDDFRERLESGHGLTLAEVLYSVVMALDSVEVNCDVEVGGLDQYLNMQMCRKVMEIRGQNPELVAATSLLEGTDGSGVKMSKSRGNYVPLTASPSEIYGKIMSIPDRLVDTYFRALSEWIDRELELLHKRVENGSLRPVDMKKVLAGEVTAAIHGIDAAMDAREQFVAQFSKRTYADLSDIAVVNDVARPITEIVRALGFAKSNGDVRRVAQQNGLRIVLEVEGTQEEAILSPDEARASLNDVLQDRFDNQNDQRGDFYLRVGRKLARLSR